MHPVARRAARIALNAHLLNLSGNYRSAGINWYIYHLLKHLPQGEFQYTALTSEKRAAAHLNNLQISQSRLPTHKPVVRIIWEQFVQPRVLRDEHFDLYHGLGFAGPLRIHIPWLVTVYDLSFKLFPQSFNPANRIYLTWAVRDAVRRADRIIAISESTKRDLVALFGADPLKISVVHAGVDSSFSPAVEQDGLQRLISRYSLTQPIVLFVGTIEPRKNLVHLIKAFKLAKLSGNLPHRLVLVGARGWMDAEVDQVIAQEHLTDSVQFTGFVPPDELPYWYHAAQVFVYPSLYEGFGLPILEAMASGVPVIGSNVSSIPEVVGDAGFLVPPKDEQALADAIVRLAKDEDQRREFAKRGLKRSSSFTWEHTANRTVEVYRTMLRTGGGIAER